MSEWRPQGWDHPPSEELRFEVRGDARTIATVIADLELVGLEVADAVQRLGTHEGSNTDLQPIVVVGVPQTVRDAIERIRQARGVRIDEPGPHDTGDGLDPRGYC